MDTKTAVDVYKALDVLSEVLGIDFQQVAARVCLFEEEKAEILKEASNKWNAFSDADVVERGVMLGVDISEPCEEIEPYEPDRQCQYCGEESCDCDML